VRADLLDLVTLWADLRLRGPHGSPEPDAARELLAALDEAERRFGASAALARQRQGCLEALGRSAEAEQARRQALRLAPRTAWEHCALGRSLLRAGEVRAAAAEFRRAVALRPQDFWPHFYEGVCAYRLGDLPTALAAFRTCVALAPERAEVWHNRALTLAALGRRDEALADVRRALQADPGHAEAQALLGQLQAKAQPSP
jgi:tetratricopeptide (TPR) repeat protein